MEDCDRLEDMEAQLEEGCYERRPAPSPREACPATPGILPGRARLLRGASATSAYGRRGRKLQDVLSKNWSASNANAMPSSR